MNSARLSVILHPDLYLSIATGAGENIVGASAHLTPEQARGLAAALARVADAVEAQQAVGRAVTGHDLSP